MSELTESPELKAQLEAQKYEEHEDGLYLLNDVRDQIDEFFGVNDEQRTGNN